MCEAPSGPTGKRCLTPFSPVGLPATLDTCVRPDCPYVIQPSLYVSRNNQLMRDKDRLAGAAPAVKNRRILLLRKGLREHRMAGWRRPRLPVLRRPPKKSNAFALFL